MTGLNFKMESTIECLSPSASVSKLHFGMYLLDRCFLRWQYTNSLLPVRHEIKGLHQKINPHTASLIENILQPAPPKIS